MREEDLVRAAQAGDAVALGLLLEAHQARLYATALALLRDPTQAQDAVQDALLVAVQRIQDLRDPAAAGAWLHTIVRNACRMRWRAPREWPEPRVAPVEPAHSEIEARLEHMALCDWLWMALEALPHELRLTVLLRYFTRHAAYAEIAVILGVPVGTVRSRLHQAKRRLTDALLTSAAAAHPDHAALVAARWRWWRAVIDQVEQTGVADLYVAEAAPDVLVEVPALGYRVWGVADYAQDMVATVAAGVRLQPTSIVASQTVSIVEGIYRNPVQDPQHCPDFHTEVHIHPNGPTTRILLVYGERDA